MICSPKASLLARVHEKLRSLGWADTSWFIADSLLRRMSFGSARLIKYYFVAQPVSHTAPSAPRTASGTLISVTDHLTEVVRQAERPERTLQERFTQRARCVVAERDGELAGFIWLCPEHYREDEVRCVYRWIPVREARWDFDVFVAPPFRMGRLFARLWGRAHALLAAENVKWTLSRINAFNAGSLAAHRKLGAVQMATGWFLVIGRLQLTFTSLAPYWHVSLRDSDAPELCFDLSTLSEPGTHTSVSGSESTAGTPEQRGPTSDGEAVALPGFAAGHGASAAHSQPAHQPASNHMDSTE